MPEEAVPPESRVQSRFSDLSCCQLQRSRSKLQLNNGAAKSERKKLNILTFFLLPGIQFYLWKDSSITIKIRKHYSSTILPFLLFMTFFFFSKRSSFTFMIRKHYSPVVLTIF